MSGIMLDTKEFVLRAGVRTFEAAAYLRSRGADTVTVKSFFANSMESRKLRGMVVMNAEMYRACAISVTDIELTIRGLRNALMSFSVSGADALFVTFKTDDIINISARLHKCPAYNGGARWRRTSDHMVWFVPRILPRVKLKICLKNRHYNYYSNL